MAIGVAESGLCARPDVPPLLQEFNEWMRRERGASDATLSNYRLHILGLLQKLGSEPKLFTAKGLGEYLLGQSKHSSQEKSKKLATVIRSFLRFLIARGDCAVGMEHAIPTIAQWPGACEKENKK